MGNVLKTVLFLIGAVFLTRLIPSSLSSFFRNLDTLIHEFGHAVVTLAVSGKVLFIELYSNHSGVTYSQIMNNWSSIPVSLAGYMTASLFAVFLFKMRSGGKERLGLQAITIVSIIALVLFVRNEFGVMWLAGFIALNILMLSLVPRWLRDFYYLVLAFLTLEESVLGPVSLVVYALGNPAAAGDATNLSRVTPIPAIGWAVLFTLFSLWCAKMALSAFLERKKQRPLRQQEPYYK